MTKTASIDPTYDNKVNWNVTLSNISPDRPINNPTITDTMKTGTTGAQLVKSSFKVMNESTGEDIDSKNYDITYTDNNFTIQFKDYKATAPIKVTYSTVSLMSGLISNTATTSSPDYGSLPMTYKSRTASASPAFTIGSGSGMATVGSLEITKVDKEDNTKKLTGAKFQLYTLEGEKAGQEATTDSEGKIVMDSLQSGKYKLVETEAPTGYTISDEYKDGKEITIGADGLTTSVTIENTKQTGSVVLVKEDSVSKAALSGAEFELQTADGTQVAEHLESNADGKIEVNDLAPGDYKFVETKAPTGYILDATPVEFTIEFNQSAATVVTKDNTAKTGSVILTKEDSETKAALSGAEFELQSADGTKLKENLTTDADGKLEVAGLAPGDYKLVETKAPTGYELDDAPVEFTIEFNQVETIQVTKTNTMSTGSVVLTKTDGQTKAPLANAVFKLIDEGNNVQENLSTDESGKLEINNLAPGNYQLIETKAPTGYELDTAPVDVKITFNQKEALQVVKTNIKTVVSGKVIAEFVDTKGNKLAAEEIHTGLIGNKYITKAKEIKGYKLLKDPMNKLGIYKEIDQKVTFVYEKNETPTIVDPKKPTKPVTKAKPVTPTKPISPSKKPATVEKGNKLPSTGDEFPYGVIFTGLFASVVGIFLLRKTKKVSK